MNIAIIGGGLTGLTAAYELLKHGHRVTVFEKEKTLGGLTSGFKPTSHQGSDTSWDWSLEYFYHHIFTNDTAIIALAKELGLEKYLLVLRPVTATLCQSSAISSPRIEAGRQLSDKKNTIGGKRGKDVEREKCMTGPVGNMIYQLDSPGNLLTFPLLSPIDKIRTAALLGFCKINPFWKPLETITAEQLFKTIGGTHAWELLWKPLMAGKFGSYAKDVPASWLWARFHKRTPNLIYIKGGFQTFIDRLAEAIIQRGGNIKTKSQILNIKYQTNFKFQISNFKFDRVLLTTPSSAAVKLLSSLHHSYIRNDSLFVDKKEQFTIYNQRLLSIPHLWAQTLILETTKPILDNTYWLNVTDRSFPFIAVVAHTNMIDKKYYGGNHITYIGNYLPDNHPFLTMTKQQLLKKFIPYLKHISMRCNDVTILQSNLFTISSAQPIHTINYSQKAPAIKTPIDGIYLANLDSIYPWDRGTNYAVELGQKAAAIIEGEIQLHKDRPCEAKNYNDGTSYIPSV